MRQPRQGVAHTVVITGGTKGFGKALAKEFIRNGDNVVICSRDPYRVSTTTVELQTLANVLRNRSKIEGRVVDIACGMREFLDEVVDMFGPIDALINNAATNAYSYESLHEQSPVDVVDIIATNALGTALGTKEALRVMRRQKYGHIFNITGGGSMGEPTPNFAIYGATKSFVNHLSRSVAIEEGSGVCVHRVNPGMVDTELLTSGLGSTISAKVIRGMAVPPDTVAKRLVPKMKQIMANPRAKSSYITACPEWMLW